MSGSGYDAVVDVDDEVRMSQRGWLQRPATMAVNDSC